MKEEVMMKRISIGALLLALALAGVGPAEAAFVIGGENGWQFSTDGFVNVFGVYQTLEKNPTNVAPAEGFLSGNSSRKDSIGGTIPTDGGATQQFQVRTGLLPEGVGFNIKSPTIGGVDMGVRIGIYPNIQNHIDNNIDISPNIDFREIYFTAEGKYGQLLAGRAINLYQAKNILTDMTLFGAGVVGPVNAGPTMGHIGYGYLYPNFGAQIRYTTPSMDGFKVAFSVNDSQSIGNAVAGVFASTINVPKLETEISYASGRTQAWLSALYQTASFPDNSPVRPGGSATSLGGAGGVSTGFGPVDVLASAWGGKGLGLSAVQWDVFGAALDNVGVERKSFGGLGQAVYKFNDSWKTGINYGLNYMEETNNDTLDKALGTAHIKSQQAVTGMLTYNLNKNLQFIAEYSWAQDQFYNGQSQASNIFALGTFFYW
jgi:hypothetical protein